MVAIHDASGCTGNYTGYDELRWYGASAAIFCSALKDIGYLDLEGFDFVAVMCSRTFNGDGHMFEYTQSRHHPDCFSFSAVARRV